MEFNIKIQGEDVKTVFECLNLGQHGKVRPVFDKIFMQVQQQEVAGNKPSEPGPDGSSTD